LAVIKACVETLLDGAVDDAEHRGLFLEQVGDQADRLNALILDLIALARIESGTEVFEFQNVSLEKIATACRERHEPWAESRGQTLTVGHQVPGAGSPWVWADEEAVAQILDNLVDNALKYTARGGSIRVSWWESDAERDLPRIFERFYRVDKARSRELGGTGLGLSIVKHLVQALHGRVHATSHPGQGSQFSVYLPKSVPLVI
jgi:two-component system phosphate regulon sensor histidine kinase PhoR